MHGFPDADRSRLDLILDCKILHAKIWQSTVNYVLRIFNVCADALAKLGHNTNQTETIWVDVIPHYHPLLWWFF